MSDPKIIDGNLISKQILEELKVEIAAIKGPQPRVTFVRVGEDPASVYYVNKKAENCHGDWHRQQRSSFAGKYRRK